MASRPLSFCTKKKTMMCTCSRGFYVVASTLSSLCLARVCVVLGLALFSSTCSECSHVHGAILFHHFLLFSDSQPPSRLSPRVLAYVVGRICSGVEEENSIFKGGVGLSRHHVCLLMDKDELGTCNVFILSLTLYIFSFPFFCNLYL